MQVNSGTGIQKPSCSGSRAPDPNLTLYCVSICLSRYLKTGKFRIRIWRIGLSWVIRRAGTVGCIPLWRPARPAAPFEWPGFRSHKNIRHFICKIGSFSSLFSMWGHCSTERVTALGSVLWFLYYSSSLEVWGSPRPVRESVVKLIIRAEEPAVRKEPSVKNQPNSPIRFRRCARGTAVEHGQLSRTLLNEK